MDNKYDSFAFKVKLNVAFDKPIQDMRAILPDKKHDDDDLATEEIRLKMSCLNISNSLI